MSERACETYLTIDGSADLKAQINNPQAFYTFANTDTTNMASGCILQRKPTTTDWTVSFDWADPDVDESSAASLIKVLYDGSLLGAGDGIYTVVIQKVSSGGTGGTATTADPTYTATMVVDQLPILGGGTDGLVAQGQTTTFSNAGATITRATS
jgi:hypothetical protein